MVHLLEQQYIADPSDSAREAWQSTQSAYEHLLSSSAENKRFFSKQAFFEEGEKTGCLLAKIAHSQQRSPAIEAIKSRAGPLVRWVDYAGNSQFLWKSLPGSGTSYILDDLETYLNGISFPELSGPEEGVGCTTIKEIQGAVSSFPNCKAPGEDGIPMEIYKQYSEILLPHLLRVFNMSLERGAMPPSMSKANIILLLKSGKDPVNPGSYQSISLLKCDMKILAKVLIVRLNGIITLIVHSDQTGFMPNKSTEPFI